MLLKRAITKPSTFISKKISVLIIFFKALSYVLIWTSYSKERLNTARHFAAENIDMGWETCLKSHISTVIKSGHYDQVHLTPSIHPTITYILYQGVEVLWKHLPLVGIFFNYIILCYFLVLVFRLSGVLKLSIEASTVRISLIHRSWSF